MVNAVLIAAGVVFVAFVVCLGLALWFTLSGRCEDSSACRARNDGQNVCSPKTNRCVECASLQDCGLSSSLCDKKTSICACGTDSDGEPKPPCDPHSETPVCVGSNCVQCTAAQHCPTKQPHCNPSTYTCFACETTSTTPQNPYPCAPGLACSSLGDTCELPACSSDTDCAPGRSCDPGSSLCSVGSDVFNYRADQALTNAVAPSNVLSREEDVAGPTECGRSCVSVGDACLAFDWRPDAAGSETGICTLYTGDPTDQVLYQPYLGAWAGEQVAAPSSSCPVAPPTSHTCLSTTRANIYPHAAIVSNNDPETQKTTQTLQDCQDFCNKTMSSQCEHGSTVASGGIANWASLSIDGDCSCYGPDPVGIVISTTGQLDGTAMLTYCK